MKVSSAILPIMTPGDRRRMDKIEDTLGRLVTVVENFAASVIEFKANTERWHQDTERRHEDTERRLQELEEHRDDSRERLNALIRIVDDIVRNRPPN